MRTKLNRRFLSGLAVSTALCTAHHALASTRSVTKVQTVAPVGYLSGHKPQFVTPGVLAFQDYTFPDFAIGAMRFLDLNTQTLATASAPIGRNDFAVTASGRVVYCGIGALDQKTRIYSASASGDLAATANLPNCNAFGIDSFAISAPGDSVAVPLFSGSNDFVAVTRVSADGQLLDYLTLDTSEFGSFARAFWSNERGLIQQQKTRREPFAYRLSLVEYGTGTLHDFTTTEPFAANPSPAGGVLVAMADELVFLSSALKEITRVALPHAQRGLAKPYLSDGWIWVAPDGSVIQRLDANGQTTATKDLVTTLGPITANVLKDGRIVLQTAIARPDNNGSEECLYDISVLSPTLVETKRWRVSCFERTTPLVDLTEDLIIGQTIDGLIAFSTTGDELYRDSTLTQQDDWKLRASSSFDTHDLISVLADRRTTDGAGYPVKMETRIEILKLNSN